MSAFDPGSLTYRADRSIKQKFDERICAVPEEAGKNWIQIMCSLFIEGYVRQCPKVVMAYRPSLVRCCTGGTILQPHWSNLINSDFYCTVISNYQSSPYLLYIFVGTVLFDPNLID